MYLPRLAGTSLVIGGLAFGTLHAVGPTAGRVAGPRPPDAAAARVLAMARAELGDSYLWGGNGPDRWDCSGLVSALWRAAGIRGVPRVSRAQQAWAWPVSAAEARPGDLVFFGDPVDHVAVYLGSGRIIDASSSRGRVVERAVWISGVVRYGRVPRSGVRRPARGVAPAPVVVPRVVVPRVLPRTAAPRVLRPVPPAGHRAPMTRDAARFVTIARSQLGQRWGPRGTGPTFDAAGLVRWAWWKAGYGVLPATPAGIESRTRRVAMRHLAVGDLVFYGSPAVHVGIYVGDGQMIDASRVLRKVVHRPVFASETVRFSRLG